MVKELLPKLPQRRLNVLVVDDNKDAAESLATLLRLLGHAAQVVYGGAAAIAKAETEHFDLMVLDINMPEPNGFETAVRIRRHFAEGERPHLTALTGVAPSRSVKDGFDDLLLKPLELKALLGVLSNL